jgi:hypothetical protein
VADPAFYLGFEAGEQRLKKHLCVFPIKISSGTYTGDGTNNRAIPHSIGRKPKIVLILTSNRWFEIIDTHSDYVYYAVAGTFSREQMSQSINATNFYVGKAGKTAETANANAGIYYWVAIG